MLLVIKQLTKGHGDATEIVHKASGNSDVIVAIGGDETCNEVINGFIITPDPKIVFDVIPNDAGNDCVWNFPTFDPCTFATFIVEGSLVQKVLQVIVFV